MAGNDVTELLGQLRQTSLLQEQAGATDGELLQRYVTCRDESAFEALVRRHGPMVLGVCRRILGNDTDVEDAFQATFLILVNKAAAIRSRGAVGNWLYGVAHNTALKAKAMNRVRRTKETAAAALPKTEAAEVDWQQVQALLDAELSHLPEKYRTPIVLCDLGGTTIKEAGRQLGWPQGTVATRLTRGRALLARRLSQRGLTLSATALAAVLSACAASASLAPTLLSATVKAARLLAAGQTVASAASPSVAVLLEGVLKAMLLKKLKIAGAVVLLTAFTCLGIGAALPSTRSEPADKPKPAPADKTALADKAAEKAAVQFVRAFQQYSKVNKPRAWPPVRETIAFPFCAGAMSMFGSNFGIPAPDVRKDDKGLPDLPNSIALALLNYRSVGSSPEQVRRVARYADHRRTLTRLNKEGLAELDRVAGKDARVVFLGGDKDKKGKFPVLIRIEKEKAKVVGFLLGLE